MHAERWGSRAVIALAFAALLGGAHPPVDFVPVGPHFSSPADEYRRIWDEDGERLIATLEALAGLSFPENRIEIIISEARPVTSYDGRSMRLRATYSRAYKKATLAHEMGHVLAFMLPRDEEHDDHRLLYLFLYDAWTDLYGPAFADRMVSIERRNKRFYDYDSAWNWALSMTRDERQHRLAMLRTRAHEAEPSAP